MTDRGLHYAFGASILVHGLVLGLGGGLPMPQPDAPHLLEARLIPKAPPEVLQERKTEVPHLAPPVHIAPGSHMAIDAATRESLGEWLGECERNGSRDADVRVDAFGRVCEVAANLLPATGETVADATDRAAIRLGIEAIGGAATRWCGEVWFVGWGGSGKDSWDAEWNQVVGGGVDAGAVGRGVGAGPSGGGG